MNAAFGWLTSTLVILLSLILTLLIGLSFAPVQNAIGGPLLDMLWTGEAAQARLNAMNEAERSVHIWGTVLNDTLYPLAYGAFLAGLAGRFAGPRWMGWAMLPAFLAVLADFAENMVQVLALTGSMNLLAFKSVLTPLKFGLLIGAAMLVVLLILIAGGRFVLGKMRG
ncbi:hypothetical protein [Henriciella sp.]|uniref:hypothetical protein n=1 Tax=Henriciella sp. TaxID=1968823 RepID=UPI002636A6B5|nr:hypothetical protein [Henriciella sp.]